MRRFPLPGRATVPFLVVALSPLLLTACGLSLPFIGGGSEPEPPPPAEEEAAAAPEPDPAAVANVFTAPQAVADRMLTATITGEPLPGSGSIGIRLDRAADVEQRPLGISWTLSGAERWSVGLDERADPFPDFVLLYNTGVGDVFRVADGGHFQMGAGIGPSPTEHLLFLNDMAGSGNENILNVQLGGDATRAIRFLDPASGGIPFAVGVDGAVGIGTDRPTDPGLMLDVVGDARAYSWDTYSDARLKEDIRPLGSVLERLAKLQAVQFRWKESGQEDIGVLAQQVEAVFPELVTERGGMKTVDYSGLTAVLLAAVSELAASCAEHGEEHSGH